MARAGRKDRGLLTRIDTTGKELWYVRLYHQGRERRFGSFSTKTAAREFYEKAKAEQRAGRFFPERYQHGGYDLVETVIDRYSKSTTKKSEKEDTRHTKWWKARAKRLRLNAMTATFLEDAQRDLVERGLAPSTVLGYMKCLRHILNLAIRDGKLERSPFAQVKLPRVTAGRTRFLSPEEESRILKALGPIHGPWARLAILTGMRRTEQFTLRWSDVDLVHGIITLRATKAGGVQYVHLNDEATAILGGLTSREKSDWVFPSENPKTHLDGRNFYRRVWLPTVTKLGIEAVTWHDLRHTYASRLAMAGQAEGTIAALLRHSTTALVKRYAHLSPSHLREAVEKVSQFGRKEEQPRSSKAPETPSEAPNSCLTVTGTGNGDREPVGRHA